MPFGERIWRGNHRAHGGVSARSKAAIVSTISGDANVHFFREYARQQIVASQSLPVMTLSIGEGEAATSLAGRADGGSSGELELSRRHQRSV